MLLKEKSRTYYLRFNKKSFKTGGKPCIAINKSSTILFRITSWAQALYYFFTAIWALVDIKSFMDVTGPKTDIWLVKTVSLILIAVSLCFLATILLKTDQRPLVVLTIASCISLAGIDFYYAEKKIISPVYYVDGILQLIFLFAWILILLVGMNKNVLT